MNKYLLLSICYSFSALCNAQTIIGDLKIESTTRTNEIKITNISDKTIENITVNGKLLPPELSSLKPSEERKIILKPINKNEPKTVYDKDKEAKALADLLGRQQKK